MNEDGLRAAFHALAAGDAAGALVCLDGLAPTGRPGFDARLAGYRAQALDALGRVEEAERSAAEAVRIATRAHDADGVVAYRALHQRLLASLAALKLGDQERARDAALVDAEPEVVLTGLEGGARAAWLIRRAGALLDAGRRADARETCQRAFAEAAAAGDAREQVLALLAAIRVDPESPLLRLSEAHAIADRADDHGLITAVARAARAAGVHLPAPEFS